MRITMPDGQSADMASHTSLKDSRSLKPAKPIPQHMRYRDIPAAVETSYRTEKNDPLVRYLLDTPDKSTCKWQKKVERMARHVWWMREVYHKTPWTINGGDSFIIPILNRDNWNKQHTPVDRLLNALLTRLRSGSERPEQTRRMQDFRAREKAGTERILGGRVKQMLYISSLMTAPQCQGRGYASALVRMATQQADEQARATWLVSSNIANLGFYESLGFYTAYRFVVGENDPTWTGTPVTVDIMVREPGQKLSEKHASLHSP